LETSEASDILWYSHCAYSYN